MMYLVPFSIPLSVNPLHASSLASTVLSLTYPLRNGSWNPALCGGSFYIMGKVKLLDLSLSRLTILKGFSSVISLLDGTDLAQNSLETVRKLELLHPVEPPFIIEKTTSNFWLDSPITKNEVSNAILKAKGGKAAGPLCDQCLELFQSNGFHGKIEPVLNTLSDSIMRDKSRGDLIDPWLSSQEIIMDFTTIDPCNSTSVNKISDENYSALETAERKN
ncbi:hypothetical protein GEMRC1_013185 [Eukaryota sp. GEM-RC1]